jgi:hypothetical protein
MAGTPTCARGRSQRGCDGGAATSVERLARVRAEVPETEQPPRRSRRILTEAIAEGFRQGRQVVAQIREPDAAVRLRRIDSRLSEQRRMRARFASPDEGAVPQGENGSSIA